ncbi:MAG: bacteriohemerythrin [Bacteroidales bacterium]
MAYFEWDENLSVKISSIDDQHKKLVEMINVFYQNIKDNSGNDQISKLVRGMKDYTRQHFSTEENYMRKFNYPDYDAHKKEHDMFITKVNELEDKLNQGKMVLSFEITKFLKEWVKNHIQGTDKKYSDFFVSKGVV